MIEKYKENLNELCQKRFNKSAHAVICKNDEICKTSSQLSRMYDGNFPTTKPVKEDFENIFKMPWHELLSYIKHGERKSDLPKGYSAALLRKKFKEERAPDLRMLLPHLNITTEESMPLACTRQTDWPFSRMGSWSPVGGAVSMSRDARTRDSSVKKGRFILRYLYFLCFGENTKRPGFHF